MSRRPRRNHAAAFKPKVAIEALADGKTIAEIAQKHDVHPHQVTEWRRQLIERAAGVFGAPAVAEAPPVDLNALHAKIDQLALENDLSGRLAQQGRVAERKAMIDRDHRLPVKCQAELLGISRGSMYYQPAPIAEAELALMRRIDRVHLEHPYAGSRMLRDLLRLQCVEVGRRHVGTLMRRMGMQALYRKPNTSRKHPAHAVFPYRCTTSPLMPCDISSSATDMPSCSHCASSIALYCDPYRRRLFPLSLVIVSAYACVDKILLDRAGRFKASQPTASRPRGGAIRPSAARRASAKFSQAQRPAPVEPAKPRPRRRPSEPEA